MVLQIYGLSTGALSFFNLVVVRMPRLNYLYTGRILLSSGTWECLIEMFRRSAYFQVFDIGYYPAELLHRGGQNFLDRSEGVDDLGDQDQHIMACEKYVSAVGECHLPREKHPCLRNDEPSEAAERFLDDIDLQVELDPRSESNDDMSDSIDGESSESDVSEKDDDSVTAEYDSIHLFYTTRNLQQDQWRGMHGSV